MTLRKCRTCGVSGQRFLKLSHTNTDENSYTTIGDMIAFCVPQVKDSISYDGYICRVCKKKLEVCVGFIQKCIEIDKLFKSNKKEIKSSTDQTFANIFEEPFTFTSDDDDDNDSFYWPNNDNEEVEKTDLEIKENKDTKSIQEIADDTTDSIIFYNDEHDYCKKSEHEVIDLPEANNTYFKASELVKIDDVESAKKFTHTLKFPLTTRIVKLQMSNDLVSQSIQTFHSAGTNVLKIFDEDLSKNETKRVLLFGKHVSAFIRCGQCDRLFQNYTKYQTHYKSHFQKRSKKRYYFCPFCDEKLESSPLLRSHLTVTHEVSTKANQCTKCSTIFRDFTGWKSHLKMFKDNPTCTFSCERCGRTFKTLFLYERHKEHIKDAPACDFEECKTCKQKFLKTDFKEHATKIHPACVCEKCGKPFHNILALKSHKQFHKDTKSCLCQHCGKGFKTSCGLRQHILTHTSEPRKYMCDRCPMVCSTAHYLKAHLQRHSNQKRLKCELCPRVFVTRKTLRQHMRLVHQKIKPHSCNICDRKFGRKDYLGFHMSRCHAVGTKNIKNKPYPRPRIADPGKPCICNYCGKKCQTLQKLKLHLETHIRLRRFKCSFCDLRFIKSLARKKHEKLHSDPNFQFRCRICWKRNTNQYELDQHIRTHTKKPYKCEVCSEAFARMYLLENHVLNTHQTRDEEFAAQEQFYAALENVTFIYSDDEQENIEDTSNGELQNMLEDTEMKNVVEDVEANFELEMQSAVNSLRFDTQENIN